MLTALAAPLIVTTSVLPAARPVTEPPTVKAPEAQLMTTLVTLPVTVPLPALTVQDLPAGCALIVTAYDEPLVTGVGNVNAPSRLTLTVSPPLLETARPVAPSRPVTV